jgi:hypothetical protein
VDGGIQGISAGTSTLSRTSSRRYVMAVVTRRI